MSATGSPRCTRDEPERSSPRKSTVDEVFDPYGGPLSGYRAIAGELDQLTEQLAGLLWPPQGAAPARDAWTGRGGRPR